MSWDYWGYPPRLTPAQLHAKATKTIASLRKKGMKLSPIDIGEDDIANTFWGKAWCDNVESYRDEDYRLQRGRSYVRHGTVIDLKIAKGAVKALVVGSEDEPYEVAIAIDTMNKAEWQALAKRATGRVESLLALAQGDLPWRLLAAFCDRKHGLFPKRKEIRFKCSCPDHAVCCKHVAAVMYGIGARLDENPGLLFTLRDVDASALVPAQVIADLAGNATGELGDADLGAMFGIALDGAPNAQGAPAPKAKRAPARQATPRTVWRGPSKNVLAERVLELRQRLGLSLTAFAHRLGVNYNQARNMENGKNDEDIFRLLGVLDKLEAEPQPAAVATGSALGERVKALRQRLRLSQYGFHRMVGVSATTVSHMEQGFADHIVTRLLPKIEELEARLGIVVGAGAAPSETPQPMDRRTAGQTAPKVVADAAAPGTAAQPRAKNRPSSVQPANATPAPAADAADHPGDPRDAPRDIIGRFKAVRRTMGLTQLAFGHELGISKSQVSSIENYCDELDVLSFWDKLVELEDRLWGPREDTRRRDAVTRHILMERQKQRDSDNRYLSESYTPREPAKKTRKRAPAPKAKQGTSKRGKTAKKDSGSTGESRSRVSSASRTSRNSRKTRVTGTISSPPAAKTAQRAKPAAKAKSPKAANPRAARKAPK